MAIGIYKQGQGYWVRVLTATLIAVLTLAAAGWTFSQMGLVAEKLPRSVWVMRLETGLATPPASGTTIALVSKPLGETAAKEIGTATVESYNPGAKELRVTNVKLNEGVADASLSGSVKMGEVAAPLAATPLGETAIDPFLLKGIAAVVVLLLGAILAYYFTAMHKRFVEFLIATDGEMKKVNWSTARDIRMSTAVVIFAAVTLAGSLFVVDMTFQWFFTTIHVITPPDPNKKG
jgi:preprotein translocase SecE subunit